MKYLWPEGNPLTVHTRGELYADQIRINFYDYETGDTYWILLATKARQGLVYDALVWLNDPAQSEGFLDTSLPPFAQMPDQVQVTVTLVNTEQEKEWELSEDDIFFAADQNHNFFDILSEDAYWTNDNVVVVEGMPWEEDQRYHIRYEVGDPLMSSETRQVGFVTDLVVDPERRHIRFRVPPDMYLPTDQEMSVTAFCTYQGQFWTSQALVLPYMGVNRTQNRAVGSDQEGGQVPVWSLGLALPLASVVGVMLVWLPMKYGKH